MTDAEARSLGARWLAVMGDRAWACGMRALPENPASEETPARVVSVRDGCVTVAWESGAGEAEGGTLLRGDVPDLRDPATLGAALGVLREVWRSPLAYIRWESSLARWAFIPEIHVGMANGAVGPTEAEALVVAAEAAKERE